MVAVHGALTTGGSRHSMSDISRLRTMLETMFRIQLRGCDRDWASGSVTPCGSGGTGRRKSDRGYVDVVLKRGGHVAHGVGIDECATDNIPVKTLNHRWRSHTLASDNASSKNPGGVPFNFGAGHGVAST